MRYFIHPEPISIDLPKADGTKFHRQLTFRAFMEETVGADPKSGANVKTLRKVAAFLDAIDKTSPGQVVAVEDDQHAIVAPILEEPSQPFAPLVARRALPFFAAVLSASSERPESTKEGNSGRTINTIIAEEWIDAAAAKSA